MSRRSAPRDRNQRRIQIAEAPLSWNRIAEYKCAEVLRLCNHASRVGKRFILRLYGFFFGGRYFFSTEATTT